MNQELLHYYRRARTWQNAHNGGGAWEGEHAIAAYWEARRQIYFRGWLKAEVAKGNKRSMAARKGWKTRRGTKC